MVSKNLSIGRHDLIDLVGMDLYDRFLGWNICNIDMGIVSMCALTYGCEMVKISRPLNFVQTSGTVSNLAQLSSHFDMFHGFNFENLKEIHLYVW